MLGICTLSKSPGIPEFSSRFKLKSGSEVCKRIGNTPVTPGLKLEKYSYILEVVVVVVVVVVVEVVVVVVVVVVVIVIIIVVVTVTRVLLNVDKPGDR